MKSFWLWIIGGFILLYALSDENQPPLRQTSQADTSYPDSTPSAFKGYNCTSDCSGHEAGYQWAEENDIDDPDDCGGNSESFIEGCRAFAEEQQDEERDDEDL